MPVRILLAAAFSAAALPAAATPQQRDATDMWFNPNESGWGLNIIHQADTLFATLFVYGADRQSKWYVASDMAGGPSTYFGTLRECTGNAYNETFNPANHSCRDVGPITFGMGDGFGSVDYTVDGVHVTKSIQRWTFRKPRLLGAYEGYIVQPASGGAAEVSKPDLTLQVRTDDGSSFAMDSSSDSQSPCTWSGAPSQDGAIETVTGAFLCSGRSGSWSMSVDPTTEGFTGSFSGDNIPSGRIAAARATGQVQMQGMGWRSDMWFVPGESGWGFNVIEQGDTLFGTLFVYDSQHNPRWYSASALTQQGDAADGRVTYTGPLYESTGPYFGGAFDPASVTRRAVGQMSFLAAPDGNGTLSYSVDGVQVMKQVQRFAFRKQDFTGSYLGSYAHDRQAMITIDDSADFHMHLVDEFGGMGTCDFTAPFAQVGSLRTMSGSYTCGTQTGSFVMQHATVSADGFTARFDSPMFDFRAITDGHIAGVRH